MISANHHSISVELKSIFQKFFDRAIAKVSEKSGMVDGGAAGRKRWPGVFTMNEGRKIDCMR